MINPVFTTSLSPEEITPAVAVKYIKRHEPELERLAKLEAYYAGQQEILRRQKDGDLSNNKLVCNHAKYIADMTGSYLIGAPVSYSSEEDIEPLTDALEKADAPTQDMDLAHDMAIFGRCYEMIYVNEDVQIGLAKLSPLNAFVVYDDTVEQKPVFAVYYYPVFNDDGVKKGYKGVISTAAYTQDIELTATKGLAGAGEQIPHFFGKVTIDEIYNNAERMSDFESVLTLIDAYNTLQSDRVNDKEQFVKALLVIKGQVLGDTDEESAEAYEAIKNSGVMVLDEHGDASFLTRQLDEGGAETLSKSISQDIHKFSGVPDMSDENFAGNVSGVAMKYKLLALEQMTKIKERYFTEGLRYRLECIANLLSVMGAGTFDVEGIKMQFTHSLPANESEIAQVISSLSGTVSQETLLSLLPFVKDPKKEADKVNEEKQANADRALETQKTLMHGDMHTPIKTR
jgi:SPP1 family phage portal protein